ncbi:MFS transporter [Nocardia sp. NPDC047648]|uniref:MFS transporter n=1 Tax=Nocardia sp. NPDC047648 TaxID=3155625 RepID=UPI0033F7E90D
MNDTNTSAADSATAPVCGSSARQVSRRWIAAFALAWLGIWMAQLTSFQLILPSQLNTSLGIGTILRQDNWQRSVADFGLISGIAAVCSAVAFPVAGTLSDRTTSRFGRRRPWIVAGSLVFSAALAVLATQHTTTGIALCWSMVIIGFSIACASLTAMIGDQVPTSQRGVVSSWISAPQAFGIILGIGMIAALALDTSRSYLLVAALLVACVAPFVLFTPDPQVSRPRRASQTLQHLLAVHDFRWTLIGRVLVNLGNSLGTSLALYYLQFGLEVTDPDTALLTLTGGYTICVVVASILSGWLSDRFRARKPFVMIAALLQTISAIVILATGSVWGAAIASAITGAGFGCFMSIDQALAADVLPDSEHNGQELGVMNIAMALPQALGPLVGAWVIELGGGFSGLYIVAAGFATLGGLSVMKVKTVR